MASESGLSSETGLIAQEVEKVIPDAVIPAPFNYKYKTINYDKILPLLVESVKTLSDKVNKLEAIISGSNTT